MRPGDRVGLRRHKIHKSQHIRNDIGGLKPLPNASMLASQAQKRSETRVKGRTYGYFGQGITTVKSVYRWTVG
jgi:hypothetical protein